MAGKVEEIENELDSNRQQLQNEQQQEVLTNEELKTVIVVCGTTGVGKSQLAIELASFLKTEIISADSMQVLILIFSFLFFLFLFIKIFDFVGV